MQKLRQDANIGINLRRLRKQHHLTQDQIAAKLQTAGSPTTRAVYSRYETGELNIRITDMILLKQIFHCTYDEFFENLPTIL